MIAAIARTIPKTYTSLAGFGFGAMYPSWRPVLVPVLVPGILEALIGEMCELLHTSHWLSQQKCNVAIPALVPTATRMIIRPVPALAQARAFGQTSS